MRSVTRSLVFSFLAVFAFCGTARAESVLFDTDYQPNIINLFSNVPFPATPNGGASGFNTPGWNVTYNPGNPFSIQLYRSGGFGVLNPPTPNPAWLTYTQAFNGTVTTNPAFTMGPARE
jgi:hypothetical protein